MQLVEARLTWGTDLLGVVHLRARREMQLADFGLPFPDNVAFSPHDLPLAFMACENDAIVLELALVGDEKALPPEKSDWRVAKGVALGVVIHATFLAMAYLGRGSEAELERDELESLKELLDREAPKRIAINAETFMPEDESVGAGNSGEHGMPTKDGEEGAMGNPASQRNSGVLARSHGVHAQETDPRPEPSVDSFGMIALLSENGYGKSAGNDTWASHDGPSAMGSIFGASIDDAIGVGGMGLSGFGEGGGGKAGGVGIDGAMGTCGPDCARGGSGQSFGHGYGRVNGTHQTRSPSIRCGNDDCTAQVNGRLPPEAIQRVVRQGFGRLRGCYESGIHRNPSLEGRIAVKFVIDRSGAVNFASVSERDMPDAEVARCVARGFESMTFPEPEGGIVTVIYPIVFELSN